jgi:hypothetical protein
VSPTAAGGTLGASHSALLREYRRLVEVLRGRIVGELDGARASWSARLDDVERALAEAERCGTNGKAKAGVAQAAASDAVDRLQAAFAALETPQTDHTQVRSIIASSLAAWHRAAEAALDAITTLDAARRQMSAADVEFQALWRAVDRAG